MEATQPSSRLHPVLWVAAVAVILFSAIGIATITGLLPMAGSSTKTAEPALQAAAPQAPVVAPPFVAPSPAPVSTAPAEPIALPPGPPAAAEPVKPKPAPKPRAAPAKPKPQPAQVAYADAPAPVVERAPDRPAEPVPVPAAAPAPKPCYDCAVVESVREVKQQGEGSGLGAVAGGVLGGVLGHQVGGGTGKKVATVAGALGGAFAGHQVEKSARSATKYEVLVRFEDGGTQVVSQDQAPVLRAGDKVRVTNGAIVPR